MKTSRVIVSSLFCAIWLVAVCPALAGTDNQPTMKPAFLKEAASEMVEKEIGPGGGDLLSMTISSNFRVERQYSCRWPFDPSQSNGLMIFEKRIPKVTPGAWKEIEETMEKYSQELSPAQFDQAVDKAISAEFEYIRTKGRSGKHTLCCAGINSFLKEHPEWSYKRAVAEYLKWARCGYHIDLFGSGTPYQDDQKKLAEYRKDPRLYILKHGTTGFADGIPGGDKVLLESFQFPKPGFQKASEGVFLKCKAERQDWLVNHPSQIQRYLMAEKEAAQNLLAKLKSQKSECESQLQEEKIQQQLKELVARMIADNAASKESRYKATDEMVAKSPNASREQLMSAGFLLREPYSDYTTASPKDSVSVEEFFSSPENQKRTALLKEGVLIEATAHLSETNGAIVESTRRLEKLNTWLDCFEHQKDAVASN